jgi:hypothetical protein
MTGQVHWFPFVVLAIAITPVIAFWAYAALANRRYRIEKTTVRCRAHDNQLLHVTLVRDAKTGAPVGIRKCAAFEPGDVVRCDKTCLPQFVQIRHAAA